ncbi:MAG TPA: hypothetical protein VIC85_21265 [Ktedonobacterales bacterium]
MATTFIPTNSYTLIEIVVGVSGTFGVGLFTMVMLARRRKPTIVRAPGGAMGRFGGARWSAQQGGVAERALQLAAIDVEHARECLRDASADRRANDPTKAQEQFASERVAQAGRAYVAHTALPVPGGVAWIEHQTEQLLLRAIYDRLRAREIAGTLDCPPVGQLPPNRGFPGRLIFWALGGERVGLTHECVLYFKDQVAESERVLARARSAANAGDDERAARLLRVAVTRHLARSRISAPPPANRHAVRADDNRYSPPANGAPAT